MQTMSDNWAGNITSPAREICARVRVYNDSTLIYTFLPTDYLQEIKITKESTNKFFGFSICQKAEIKVIDKEDVLALSKGQTLNIQIGCKNEYAAYPSFFIENVSIADTKGIKTITAYDKLYEFSKHTASELNIAYPDTFYDVIGDVAGLCNVQITWDEQPDNWLYTEDVPINISGAESLRELIDAGAEITKSICFMGADDFLHFKKLHTTIDLEIQTADYFNLT